jgi:hypothetical protein
MEPVGLFSCTDVSRFTGGAGYLKTSAVIENDGEIYNSGQFGFGGGGIDFLF